MGQRSQVILLKAVFKPLSLFRVTIAHLLRSFTRKMHVRKICAKTQGGDKRIVHLCLLQSECQCVVDEIIFGTKDGCVTNPYERAYTYW